jgi:hypothetical protein
MIQRRQAWVFCLLISLILFGSGPGNAGPLHDRLSQFPDWNNLPPTQLAKGDLAYPSWFQGNWMATSTLMDLVAPLAPDVMTPGFESNRQYLNDPVRFEVRFIQQQTLPTTLEKFLALPGKNSFQIVSDRAFNGFNIAQAYLGEDVVTGVEVDPKNPNRQLTRLKGNLELLSVVTQRAVEAPEVDEFITTEVFQQIFRGTASPYLNTVETTTDYTYDRASGKIIADQVTAIYLSPNDPNYFKALDRPVSLYRYELTLEPL